MIKLSCKEETYEKFQDYHPENAPSESETLKKAVTAPDPALESSAAELTRKIAAAYNGKNSNEMLRNILSEAERSKRAGTLSNAEIDAFTNNFRRFWTADSAVN